MANELKIVVAGASGRMGQEIIKVVLATPGVTLAGALERPGHAGLGRDLAEVLKLEGLAHLRLESDAAKALALGDVLIDFTSPAATAAHAVEAKTAGKKMVIGTTGLSATEEAKVKDLGQVLPCVMASNFSVGVNLFWKLAAMAAKVTGETYDVEIIEAHHNQKKDAPSGTALTTARVLAESLGLDLKEALRHGREGKPGERTRREIGMHAVRGGDIVGDHTVLFAGPGETLEITHRAQKREIFARGAVQAALWLNMPGRKPGLYDMQDVLGLKG